VFLLPELFSYARGRKLDVFSRRPGIGALRASGEPSGRRLRKPFRREAVAPRLLPSANLPKPTLIARRKLVGS
jgi:hypothetical protein